MTANTPLTPPDYLSPSSIATFKQCPLKFKYSRIDRLVEPPTEATLRGNFVHDVLEQLYLLDPDLRTKANAKEIARQFWDERWETQVVQIVKGADAIREFRWTSWWCIDNLWTIENPSDVKPTGLEFEIKTPISGVMVRGFIDRFSVEDDEITISDYKTGKKPSPAFAADRFFQLYVYAAALEEMEVGIPTQAELLYLKESTKVGSAIGPEQIEKTAATIVSVNNKIIASCEKGSFEAKTSKLCGWCYFKSICPAWQGAK